MDKKYVTLFKELAQNAAVSAEMVMDYDHELKDEQGLKVATTMRDDFQNLADRVAEAGENYVVNKADAAKLLVSSLMLINQMSFQSYKKSWMRLKQMKRRLNYLPKSLYLRIMNKYLTIQKIWYIIFIEKMRKARVREMNQFDLKI